jgi:RNA polymerase sigma-70 factor (ECF subfamily)
VFRLAASILGQEFQAEAEEVAQEVFVRVHHALATFRGEAQFGTWVYRIAFNQAVNLKARVRYRAPHVSDQALATTPSSAAGPLRQLEETQRDQALMECIHELPEVYQAALRLHYWMDTSLADIAQLIGVPENTVKSYLHRARKLLHAMLEERGFENV